MSLPLEEQCADLRSHLSRRSDPQVFIRHWVQSRGFEKLIPASALPQEKELFIRDLRIVAAVVYCDLQEPDADPDLIVKSAKPATSKVMDLTLSEPLIAAALSQAVIHRKLGLIQVLRSLAFRGEACVPAASVAGPDSQPQPAVAGGRA